jgi:hypothetical protein
MRKNGLKLYDTADLRKKTLSSPHFDHFFCPVCPSSEFSSQFLASRLRSTVPDAELRRAAISVLLSALVLPQHFRSLPINRLLPHSGGRVPANRPSNFLELRPRLLNVLTHALQYEADALNTAMLLGESQKTVCDAA